MSTFSLKIISTDKVFYEGKCEYLVIPTIDGEKKVFWLIMRTWSSQWRSENCVSASLTVSG